MGFIGGNAGYWLLRTISPNAGRSIAEGDGPVRPDRLRTCFGPRIVDLLAGKRVLDFGCGEGHEVIEAVRLGAISAMGIDVRPSVLEIGRARACASGLPDRCFFSLTPEGEFDVVLSMDAFEHFDDPQDVLRLMFRHTAPGGRVLISFGPTWYHPMGGHLFSVFPWSHLVFTEAAQIRWRADFKADAASRFSEVEGGLNQMTIKWFERIVEESGFLVRRLDCVPIRRLSWLAGRLTREFTTAVVRAELVKLRAP